MLQFLLLLVLLLARQPTPLFVLESEVRVGWGADARLSD